MHTTFSECGYLFVLTHKPTSVMPENTATNHFPKVFSLHYRHIALNVFKPPTVEQLQVDFTSGKHRKFHRVELGEYKGCPNASISFLSRTYFTECDVRKGSVL
jgi:hypothetical protein